jgi:hypothetical protein
MGYNRMDGAATRGSGWMRSLPVTCLSILLAVVQPLYGCPLCEALSSTLRDDLQVATVALIGTVRLCTSTDGKGADVEGVYQIRIDDEVTWLKHASITPRDIRLQSLTELKRGTQVLVLGFDATCERDESARQPDANQDPFREVAGSVKEWVWVPPVVISSQTRKYLISMPAPEIPEDERLLFFYEHLSSSDRMVSDDAYNECARAPLNAVQSQFFLDRVEVSEILAKLRDTNTPEKYKSFYWMLLAEKGGEQHRDLFHELAGPWLMQGQQDSDQNATRLVEYPPWIPAAIATFVRLGGESSIRHIEEKILSNPHTDMPLVFYAVSAFRALGNELKAVDRNRMAQSFELLLDQPRAADLIIADLARWEHWTAIAKLRKLFDEADPETTFVRTPIINFLRSCPLPEAATELAHMQTVDPKAYRRAVTLLPTIGSPTATDK